MSQHKISSKDISVKVNEKGAEICSVIDNKGGFEFIWNANPNIWNRHAPVLFPIVGKLNNNKIEINQQSYSMNQHGFARDLEFEPIEIYSDLVKMMLSSNEQTQINYPFDFRFFITYQVVDNKVIVTYSCLNTGNHEMFFSVGAHPGFALPTQNLDDYQIQFEKPESLERHLLSNGLLNGEIENLGDNQLTLNLNSKLFDKDAIIFKKLNSSWLKLVQTEKGYSIKLEFGQFDYMGIWTKAGCNDFLCLEPWNGITDYEGFAGNISQKEGIITLNPGEEKSFSYTLEFTAG